MINNKVFIPPFKIQGIKSKLVPLIKSTVIINNTSTWIEPFMGSAVVGLNIAPKNAIFADLNPYIVDFYNQLKKQTITANIVRYFLEEQGELLAANHDKHYYYVRDRFNKEHSPLDFLFLNRSCFNGMIRFNKKKYFNVPYGHKPHRFSKAYITKVVNQVAHFEQMLSNNNWHFLNQSFEDTIAMAADGDFIYCDPPYIGRHVDYFDSWNEEQEKQLKSCLVASNSRFMLSTWDNNKYRENPCMAIWSDYEKITHEHFYFIGAKEENRNAMTEALITNYKIIKNFSNEKNSPEQLQLIFD